MMPLLLALLLLFMPLSAGAQETNNLDSKAATTAAEAVQKEKANEGRIKPTSLNVTLVPIKGAPDQVGLRFAVPDVVNGCWDFSDLTFEASPQEPFYYDIEIGDYTRTPGACDGSNKAIAALVPLDRDDIEAGKIKILRLTDGRQNDRYELTYKDGLIEIMPKSQTLFKVAAPLLYHFAGAGNANIKNSLGEKLVALIIPSAPMGMDTHAALNDFAAMHGLTPAPEDATSSEAKNDSGTPVAYYYDPQNRLSVDEEFSEVGRTTLQQSYDTVDGRSDGQTSQRVFAKRVR